MDNWRLTSIERLTVLVCSSPVVTAVTFCSHWSRRAKEDTDKTSNYWVWLQKFEIRVSNSVFQIEDFVRKKVYKQYDPQQPNNVKNQEWSRLEGSRRQGIGFDSIQAVTKWMRKGISASCQTAASKGRHLGSTQQASAGRNMCCSGFGDCPRGYKIGGDPKAIRDTHRERAICRLWPQSAKPSLSTVQKNRIAGSQESEIAIACRGTFTEKSHWSLS